MSRKIITKNMTVDLVENPIPINYDHVPNFEGKDYLARIKRLWDLPQSKEFDTIIIYGDREHFSNMHYLTGFDPRFEEALLVLKRGEQPAILVGNEGWDYGRVIPYDINMILYQPFGLMGQPHDKSQQLDIILKDLGLEKDSKIGLIGWKYYEKGFFGKDKFITDVPYYLVEIISSITPMENIKNATALLADCEYGLRHNIDAKEIIHFELAGTKASRKTYNSIKNLKVGMREIEAAEFLCLDGDPLSNHPNVNFGDKNASLALRSPTYDKKLELGDIAGVGFGLRGSLVHKSGYYINSEADLPEEKSHYLEEFVKPYFNSVALWYESVKIGVTAGEIYDVVDNSIGIKKFGIGLNPGHLIHTDEWSNTPFNKDSKQTIHSGMAIQCDYTVAFKDPYMTCHIEDGVVIADKELRDEIKALSPSCFERIQARRDFMINQLGINLPDELLPISDLPGVCFPFMADVTTVLAVEK